MSRQKELDADLIATQPIEHVGKLKNKLDDNVTDAGNNQFKFVLTILEKIKEIPVKFSQGRVKVL